MTYVSMTLCVDDETELVERDFQSQDLAETWIEENYPGWLPAAKRLWQSPDRDPAPGYIKQYGTNYHWVWFETMGGDLPTSATLVLEADQETGPEH